MGLEQFRSALRRHRRIALDTSIFIDHLEAYPRYADLADSVFSWLDKPANLGFTSTITMTELLVAPYRQSNQQRVDEFYGLLSTYPHLTWVPVDLEIADTAASLRSTLSLRTPDAIQAATAKHSRSSAIITNDSVFTRILGITTLVLDQYLV